MFLIDATTDFAEAVARLVRLMYNIERGARVYEWGPGSSEEANRPAPKAGFLTITVPGVTKAAPPATVAFRPSVAFVYYVPGVDLGALVGEVQARLERLPDDHLRGYLPVEATPHATLLHRNRTRAGSDVTGQRHPFVKGWNPAGRHPARHFHYTASEVKEVPSHISHRGAFTWHFLPISTATRIRGLDSFEEFNALVSGIFLDTFLGGKEVAEPVYDLSADFFNVPAAPPAVVKALQDASETEPIILVYRDGRFHPCGKIVEECLSNWAPPQGRRAAGQGELSLANVAPGPVGGGECGFCRLPLWGDIFAVEDALIAPYRVAACEWCTGCLPAPRRDEAIPTKIPRTLAEAYRDSKHANLLPLLEAEVEAIKVRSATFFRVTPKPSGGDPAGQPAVGYFLEASDDDGPPKTAPPCLRFPELREHRVSSIVYKYLAQVQVP